MTTRAQAISTRFAKTVSQIYPAQGPSQTTSLFTVYRRTTVPPGGRNDLGLEARPTLQDFAVVAAGEVGVFYAVRRHHERWEVTPEGQHQTQFLVLFTVFDLRMGDNVRLAYDGRVYLVAAASYADIIRQCLLDSTKAQVV